MVDCYKWRSFRFLVDFPKKKKKKKTKNKKKKKLTRDRDFFFFFFFLRAFAAKHRRATQRKGIVSFRVLIGLVVSFALGLWVFSLVTFHQEKQAQESAVLRGATVQVEEKNVVRESEQTHIEDEEKELVLYSQPGCKGDVIGTISASTPEQDEEKLYSICDTLSTDGKEVKSFKLTGVPEADFFSSCDTTRQHSYTGTLFRSEGCMNRYNYPPARSFRFIHKSSLRESKQIPDSVLEAQWGAQDHHPVKAIGTPAKYRFIFSCESSTYFSYQVWANYYGYLTSGQKSAQWTRLMTGRKRDDLDDAVTGLATFQAKRGLYSRRYSPINKPDVISKWFESLDRPQEEIMVVIDPDNWLIKDVSKYVDMVRPGHAVGEPAYYHGSRTAQKLWKAVCLENCDFVPDLVGVPYVVHREDLARIAPLWRMYTIMLKDRADKDQEFAKKYGHLDLAWASEMFGYNYAAAHLGIRHEVVKRIQVRDVDHEHRHEKLQHVTMLHVGRAWFPKESPGAKTWAHTEGKSFSSHGQQVWCKCNYTAAAILPWPLPPNCDFQSTHTLRLMHEANERFGPVPENREFRQGSTKHGYGAAMD